jgi:hypothetical protein
MIKILVAFMALALADAMSSLPGDLPLLVQHSDVFFVVTKEMFAYISWSNSNQYFPNIANSIGHACV